MKLNLQGAFAAGIIAALIYALIERVAHTQVWGATRATGGT